jgi:predicted TIM-barrel fold metal-dependent hydrolase
MFQPRRMIIDIHAHMTTSLTDQIKRARDAGVDRTVLLSTRQHPEQARTLEDLRAEWGGLSRVISGASSPDEWFRAATAELLAGLDAHPGEVTGFVNVPLGRDTAATAAWLDPYLSRPDVRGIGELTPAPDKAALIEPVLAASTELGGLPVLVHGYAPNTAGDIRTYAERAARYPRVPVIVGALGGLNWMDLTDLAAERPNLYIDLSSAIAVFAIRIAALTVPGQCLFGSNTPYGDVVATRVTAEVAITDQAVRRQVLEDNPAHLGLGGEARQGSCR